jgi:hypothetical protein
VVKRADIKSEPGIGTTEEQLAVLPFTEMRDEVTASGFGSFHALNNCIRVNVESAGGNDVLNVLGSLLDIALDIHGETRGFGNSKPEIQRNDTRNTAQANEYTPAIVNMLELVVVVIDNLILEPVDDAKGHYGSSYKFRMSERAGYRTMLTN